MLGNNSNNNSSSSSNNPSNNGKTLEDIEKEIGPISGEYGCHYKHIQGKLYSGSEGVLFFGHIFFFEHQRKFLWKQVLSVQKTNPDNICLIDNNKEAHVFTSVHQGERVWATLYSLHKECLNGTREGKMRMLKPIRASLRRMSSDPTASTTNISAQPEAAYVAAATLSTMEDMRSLSTRRDTTTPTANINDLVVDLEAAWEQLHEQRAASYAETALKEKELPCSLDQFFKLFLADNAKHSMACFMEEEGDEGLTTSDWVKEGVEFKRTIEYSHPVNAPLAPPKARARKEQRYRRFGKHGISIETDTYVDDVPMTDCFYVTDRILISPNGDNKVSVSAHFDIRFIKSTMFRAIIANTTRSEFLKMFQTNFSKMLTALGEPAKMVPVDVELPVEESTPPIGKVVHSVAMYVLVGFVVFLQLWALREMRGMKETMLRSEMRQEFMMLQLRDELTRACSEVATDVYVNLTNRIEDLAMA